MGDFEDKAPTISTLGVLEAEALAEVEVYEPPPPPTPPKIKLGDVRKIMKFASVYGRDPSTVKSEGKKELVGKSIEQVALELGLWPEQVRQVMAEWKAIVAGKK